MANLLPRIGFIDETSLKTNMAKTTGWSAKGARLTCHAPFGHWNTQTFIAALRHDRLDAPWVINGAMNRDLFELYVETQLAPTLQPGDVIILDNLSSHKSPKAADAMKAVGAWFLFLPPYDTRRCHDAVADRGADAVIPPRKNAKPWKPSTAGAIARNEALRASKYLGRAIWRKWTGYHRRSRAETKMNCVKLLGQSLMARDFDRQVAELQIRAAVLNGYTALGIPITEPMG